MSNARQHGSPAGPPIAASPTLARKLDQILSALWPVLQDIRKASVILRRQTPALRALLRTIAGPHPPAGSLIRALLIEAKALAAEDETEMALSGPLFWPRQVLRQCEQGQPAAILRSYWGPESWGPSPRARALLDHVYAVLEADCQAARVAQEKQEARRARRLTVGKLAPAGDEG